MNIKYSKTIMTSLVLSMGLLALTACSSTDSDDAALGGKSSTQAAKGAEYASAEAEKVARDYQKVAVNFIRAREYSLLALGKNADANKAKAEGDALENNSRPSVDDSTNAMNSTPEVGAIKDAPALDSAEAKAYFKKSVAHLSKAVAQEALLVKLVVDVAKNAKAQISAASFMQKPKLISGFTPIIDLAGRLPQDLEITTVTLADYISYAARNGISKSDLDSATDSELENN